MPPSRQNGRAFAEHRYRDLRRLAFEAAECDLAEAGIEVALRFIDAAALAASDGWHSRRVTWKWNDLASYWRRGRPERFEVAVWNNGVLCGLALGHPSKGPSHLGLHFIEGGNPNHPLRGELALIVIAAMRSYAVILGKQELRLIDPLPEVIPFYCSPEVGFELVRPDGDRPYCRRRL
jgi:hypothetical protein